MLSVGRGTIGYGSELRVCVSMRKKLQLYEYKKSYFTPMKVQSTSVHINIVSDLVHVCTCTYMYCVLTRTFCGCELCTCITVYILGDCLI